MKIYLISFTSYTNVVARTDLQSFFDTQPAILNWFGIMPQAILVATNSTDKEISSMLESRFGNKITFLITKTEPDLTQGFINKEVWEFINNPKPSGAHGLSGLLGNN